MQYYMIRIVIQIQFKIKDELQIFINLEKIAVININYTVLTIIRGKVTILPK